MKTSCIKNALGRIAFPALGMLPVLQVSAAPIEPMGMTDPGATNQLIIRLKSQKGPARGSARGHQPPHRQQRPGYGPPTGHE